MLLLPPCTLLPSISTYLPLSDTKPRIRESLPILSAGAAFTLIVPSAFVTFPTAALEMLHPRARARIISAGPFHNLVFWGILMLVQGLGAGDVFWSVGYKDVSDMGRVVVGVDVVRFFRSLCFEEFGCFRLTIS